ncbi:CLUMA_CG013145, isoform A [Clunio marinus]|uniref:CLUMA_CG013145, isoform A n=1 Tax=Clunio marinus TaxID=568069 RepID=A0A1J1IJA1_9DIPT|nr:CLUMA_CG013145, isoform A [Clunio marinus]
MKNLWIDIDKEDELNATEIALARKAFFEIVVRCDGAHSMFIQSVAEDNSVKALKALRAKYEGTGAMSTFEILYRALTTKHTNGPIDVFVEEIRRHFRRLKEKGIDLPEMIPINHLVEDCYLKHGRNAKNVKNGKQFQPKIYNNNNKKQFSNYSSEANGTAEAGEASSMYAETIHSAFIANTNPFKKPKIKNIFNRLAPANATNASRRATFEKCDTRRKVIYTSRVATPIDKELREDEKLQNSSLSPKSPKRYWNGEGDNDFSKIPRTPGRDIKSDDEETDIGCSEIELYLKNGEIDIGTNKNCS